MEKNIARHISDKLLITTIYRELKKLKSQKVNDSMKKWGYEQKFFKGRSTPSQ
jgi:hypothetical protein